jgi:hypothetical protein
MHRIRRWSAIVGLTAAGALATALPSAHAGQIADGADCSVQRPLTQPFVPWLDYASYALAPDGGFEAGAAGWTLSGGAATVAGNEHFFVGDGGDSRSLRLPSGSRAISAPLCVGLEWPTIKFFGRATGSWLSVLLVDVVFDDALTGATRSLPIGLMTSRGEWQPSLPMITVINALGALSKDGLVPVAFRFAPLAGTWQVDDLYVDPWRGP